MKRTCRPVLVWQVDTVHIKVGRTSKGPAVCLVAAWAGFSHHSAHAAHRAGCPRKHHNSEKTRSSPPKVQSDVNPPYATSTMSPHMPIVCVWKCVGPSVHVVNRLDGRSCCIYQPCTHGAKSAQTRRRAPHPTAGSCSTHKTGPRNTCRGPRMRGIQPATERRAAGGRHVAVGCARAALMCRGVEIHRNGEREGALHT